MPGDGSGRAVAERLYEAFTGGDLASVFGLLDPDISWELVGPAEVAYFGRYRGHDEVRRFFALLGEHCVVEALEAQRFTETDDGVVVQGLERGSFRGHPLAYEMRWCHVMTVREGRIVRFVDYMDTAPMLAAWRS